MKFTRQRGEAGASECSLRCVIPTAVLIMSIMVWFQSDVALPSLIFEDILPPIRNVTTSTSDPHLSRLNQAQTSLYIKNPNFTGKLEPLWQCRDQEALLLGRQRKFVFVHVFKTAGSTLRELFYRYAQKCNAGFALVIHCSHVSLPSLEGPAMSWQTGNGEKFCHLKKGTTRDREPFDTPQYYMNTSFLNQHVDLLAGHFPIGVDYFWKNNQTHNHFDVQYLVFFRDAIQKYVSAVLYNNQVHKDSKKFSTLDEAVPAIKQKVAEQREKGGYSNNGPYKSYLISPKQRQELQDGGIDLTPEEEVQLIMSNLVGNRVLIGIVERMSESLEMLHYLLDGQRDVTELFEDFGMKDADGNMNRMKKNKSKLSSSAVVKELEKDEDFMVVMREFVKFDEQLYDFALDLHMQQYRWFQQWQKGSKQAL